MYNHVKLNIFIIIISTLNQFLPANEFPQWGLTKLSEFVGFLLADKKKPRGQRTEDRGMIPNEVRVFHLILVSNEILKT